MCNLPLSHGQLPHSLFFVHHWYLPSLGACKSGQELGLPSPASSGSQTSFSHISLRGWKICWQNISSLLVHEVHTHILGSVVMGSWIGYSSLLIYLIGGGRSLWMRSLKYFLNKLEEMSCPLLHVSIQSWPFQWSCHEQHFGLCVKGLNQCYNSAKDNFNSQTMYCAKQNNFNCPSREDDTCWVSGLVSFWPQLLLGGISESTSTCGC